MKNQVVYLGESHKRTFVRAFLKGLGAPVMLLGDYELPEEMAGIDFEPLPPAGRGSIAGDWRRVGAQIQSAIGSVEASR